MGHPRSRLPGQTELCGRGTLTQARGPAALVGVRRSPRCQLSPGHVFSGLVPWTEQRLPGDRFHRETSPFSFPGLAPSDEPSRGFRPGSSVAEWPVGYLEQQWTGQTLLPSPPMAIGSLGPLLTTRSLRRGTWPRKLTAWSAGFLLPNPQSSGRPEEPAPAMSRGAEASWTAPPPSPASSPSPLWKPTRSVGGISVRQGPRCTPIHLCLPEVHRKVQHTEPRSNRLLNSVTPAHTAPSAARWLST